MKYVFILFSLPLLLAAAPSTQSTDGNDQVLRAARAFKDGGGYVTSGGSGTPEEIRFNADVILPKGERGTYCSGFTFAVVMRAARELRLLEGKALDQIKLFQREWYGAVADKIIREQQAPLAMEHLGIGRSIPHDQARAGDFCQFWRTSKTGHSAVFLNWIAKDGKRIGFRYRSSQPLTKGVGDHSEYFADTGIKNALVLRDRLYFGRLGSDGAKR